MSACVISDSYSYATSDTLKICPNLLAMALFSYIVVVITGLYFNINITMMSFYAMQHSSFNCGIKFKICVKGLTRNLAFRNRD